MLTIALTGGIGSGKTVATDYFQKIAQYNTQFDCLHIIDADIIARELLSGSLYHSPSTALNTVRILFGSDLFHTSGQLNRQKLRTLIFSSDSKKKQLNDLLHPLIYQEINNKMTAIQKLLENSLTIVAIPLLFETQSKHEFDRILVIDSPIELQIERSIKRDHCSTELIKKMIHSQVDRQTRLNHADDIIDNSGTREELQEQVALIFQYYGSLAQN